MKPPLKISRRIFVNRIGKGLLGCSVGSSLAESARDGVKILGNPTADSVIYLFMDGGMSQLDTFDLRPDNREVQGALYSIKTKVPGTHVTSNLPGLAARMDKIAQIRSMAHAIGSHARAKFQAAPDFDSETLQPRDGENFRVFELPKERRRIRESYGKSAFGQGCLRARQLVEAGARFVNVELGGWDTHTGNHSRVASNCHILDQGLSALLTDLDDSGMLERTLVVLTTEFGRSPEINAFGGRNHNPSGFTSLLMGGGVIGGAIHGKTESGGRGVSEDPVTPWDLNATIAHALGDQRLSIAGKPITTLFG